MKISILIILLTNLISLSGYALDPNLDPNLGNGYTGAASADMNKFVEASAPAKSNSLDCEICKTVGVDRHAPTVAHKRVSGSSTTGAPSTGADSSGNGP